jgi:alanyl-tRNA synthetase
MYDDDVLNNFIQFSNRSESGELERLPLSHVVDTGAGLERLTAVLNGKISNYDTDLFLPIFDTVKNVRINLSTSSQSVVERDFILNPCVPCGYCSFR